MVVGSCDQLGNWVADRDSCKMTWTEGHVWTSEEITVRAESYKDAIF